MNVVSRRALVPVLALVLLVVAAWFYLRKPAVQTAEGPAPAASSASPAPLSASQVERGIDTARAQTERDPKDAAAWAMLAHSHEMVGRFDEAAKAYEKLLALRPDDAQAHADYADALGVVNKGSLQGEPARQIAQALKLEPTNLKALLLGGKEAFERKKYPQAIEFWEKALAATQDPSVRRPLETSIAEARAFTAEAGGKPVAAPEGSTFVAGRVSVTDDLKDKVAPEDTVFIFARPAEGSRMPVALLRKRGSDLPLDFALDDSLAMVQTAKLSQYPKLLLGVRVSKRGDAIPVAGDLEGELGPVKLGETGLKLQISRVRP
jgi:cytochrome c-type biogenesis protein CcmH